MKRITGRIVLVLMSVALAIGILEVLFRKLGLASLPPDPMAHVDRSEYRYRAAAERLHPWASTQTNAIRVAVVGDSFTLGGGVQFDDAYPFRLERLLNLCSGVKPVDVRVFGASGTSTYQQLKYLDQALEWKPAVVVLGICMNDTEDWTRSDELRRWRSAMNFQPPQGWLQTLTEHSHVLTFAYVKLDHARANRGYRAYYQHLYDPNYTGWHLFADSLAAFQDRCSASGTEFIALLFPLLSEPFDEGRYPFEPMHRQVLEVLVANNIRYVNLLEPMRGKDPVRMQAIPNLDPHPSEIAHRIAAEALFTALLTSRSFAQGYVPHLDHTEYLLWEERVARREGLLPAHP